MSERKKQQLNIVEISVFLKLDQLFIHIWTPPRGLRGLSASLISRAKAIWNGKKKKSKQKKTKKKEKKKKKKNKKKKKKKKKKKEEANVTWRKKKK